MISISIWPTSIYILPKKITVLTVHGGNTAARIQNFLTGPRNDHQHLLQQALLLIIVSVFNIGSDGLLSASLNPNYFERGGGLPPGDTKDMYETPDGYLYVSGAFHTHTITIQSWSKRSINRDWRISLRCTYIGRMISEQQAYLGLKGFEK